MTVSLLPELALDTLRGPLVNRLIVGFSGGLDSVALLHAVVQDIEGPEILALHINHGLHPDSDHWQTHCQSICRALGVDLLCERVQVNKQHSVETAARLARYRAFEETLKAGDLLLLAHHEDDQRETAFFQLLRGHSGAGLLGMPMLRPLGPGQIFRPLLGVPQAVLQRYAKDRGLGFIDDPSNQDLSHDRNFIRHQIFPLLNSRFGGWSERFISQLSEDEGTRHLLIDVARDDLRSIATEAGWDIFALMALGDGRAMNALKTLLMLVTGNVPARAQIEACYQMLTHEAGQSPGIFKVLGFEFHRHQGAFNLVPELSSSWQQGPLSNETHGTWRVEGCALESKAALGGVKTHLPGLRWTLDKKGKTIDLGQRIRVSELLSQASIPVWARLRLPLLEFDRGVVAIPALPRWQFDQLTALEYAESDEQSGRHFIVTLEDDLNVKGIVLSP
jgi:tRNA(Ile)-lysidine synthase